MIGRIVRLDRRKHNRKAFDCGNADLNRYLHRFARQGEDKDIARVFVAEEESDHSEIVGYYSLSMAQITLEDLPETRRKGLPAYPVPVARMARLAVSSRYKGEGIGALLLVHALRKVLLTAGEVAAYAVVVDAKTDAIPFYEKYGFMELVGGDPSKLFLPLATIAQLYSSEK